VPHQPGLLIFPKDWLRQTPPAVVSRRTGEVIDRSRTRLETMFGTVAGPANAATNDAVRTELTNFVVALDARARMVNRARSYQKELEALSTAVDDFKKGTAAVARDDLSFNLATARAASIASAAISNAIAATPVRGSGGVVERILAGGFADFLAGQNSSGSDGDGATGSSSNVGNGSAFAGRAVQGNVCGEGGFCVQLRQAGGGPVTTPVEWAPTTEGVRP